MDRKTMYNLRPSFFELVLRDQLLDLLKPASYHVLASAAEASPRLHWIDRFREEIYFGLLGLLQHYFLTNYSGTVQEVLYGLQRRVLIPQRTPHRRSTAPPAGSFLRPAEKVPAPYRLGALGGRGVWCGLLLSVGVPYMHAKLDRRYEEMMEEEALAPPDQADPQQQQQQQHQQQQQQEGEEERATEHKDGAEASFDGHSPASHPERKADGASGDEWDEKIQALSAPPTASDSLSTPWYVHLRDTLLPPGVSRRVQASSVWARRRWRATTRRLSRAWTACQRWSRTQFLRHYPSVVWMLQLATLGFQLAYVVDLTWFYGPGDRLFRLAATRKTGADYHQDQTTAETLQRARALRRQRLWQSPIRALFPHWCGGPASPSASDHAGAGGGSGGGGGGGGGGWTASRWSWLSHRSRTSRGALWRMSARLAAALWRAGRFAAGPAVLLARWARALWGPGFHVSWRALSWVIRTATSPFLELGSVTAGLLLDYTRFLLLALLFAYKFLQWYLRPDRAHPSASDQQIPPPPPVPTPHPNSQCLPLPADKRVCPLCRACPRVNDACCPSGYLACYACLHSFVEKHHKCPVTWLPCDTSQIRRVYVT